MIKSSIIITCHNMGKYIVRAINSCLNQNFPEDQYEIIIVDDASTDSSRELISLYKNFSGYGHIKIEFLSKNKGVAYASNVGVGLSRGKYIVRVDGDDYIHRDFLQVMTQVLEWNPEVGFVHCDLIEIKGEGRENQRRLKLNTFEKLLDHGAGVMFRKKHLCRIGCYNEKLRNCEDYELLLRYSSRYPGYHLRLPYYRYFKERNNSLSSQKKEREKLKKQILNDLGMNHDMVGRIA